MILHKLSILNYKNILQAEIDFSSGINCFFGNNGMGKTNLLDAVYYLSFCKSHANTPDSQIIRNGQEMCVIEGKYDYDRHEEDIFCGIRTGQHKKFRRNKKEYQKLSEHIGLLPLVMVSPADHILIQGGSEERRRFLDIIISQQDKTYLAALIQYNKALMQRNTMLRNQSYDDALYESIELILERNGLLIHDRRQKLITDLIPVFNRFYQIICNSTEVVGLKYVSQLDRDDFEERMRNSREHDRILGFTSVGAHKDDLEMTLDDRLIRRVGSEGQNKTFLISLKLAQFDFLEKHGQTTPILLFDDIFDKLDAARVEQIIELVSQGHFKQIFITDTNRKHLDQILTPTGGNFALFQVNNGEVKTMEGTL